MWSETADSAVPGERLHAPGGGDAADRGHVEPQYVERVRVEERAEGRDVSHLVADADRMAGSAPDRGATGGVLGDERILEPGERRIAPERDLRERLLARAPAVARVDDEPRPVREPGGGRLEPRLMRPGSGRVRP